MTVEVAKSEKNNFSIPVFALVKSAQLQHGLRHGDYQRYHQYISRKLRRMRKSLHFMQGTRSKVVPKKITPEIVVDPRFIILAVFEIERSWAYAMQLKAESNSELRKRFQMFSRLRRAVFRATQLCELADELPVLGAQTRLELRAYKQWLHGVLFFERQDWAKAKEYLESAQAIYDVLLEAVDEDNRAIYKSRIDDLLPQIRYCAYTIGDETAATDLQRMRAHAQDGSSVLAELQLDQLLSQARASQASQVTEVTWLGYTIPVKLEKAKLAILTVKESEEELQKAETTQAKLAVYEPILKSCVEAITSLRDEVRIALASDATGDKGSTVAMTAAKSGHSFGSDKVARLQLLYNYLQYLKLCKTIDRTLLHIENSLSSVSGESGQVKNGIATSEFPKPQEVSRFYDTLVQNYQELIGLPCLVQSHDGFKDLLQAKMLANRSFRCYYLALAYNHGKKYAECSALLARAKQHAEQAIKSLSNSTATWNPDEETSAPGLNPPDLVKSLEALIRQAESEDLTCRATFMLDMAETNDRKNAKLESSTTVLSEAVLQKPLIDRLDVYLDEKSVEKSLSNSTYPFVHLPPNFEPVPVKPIFFDLALNHINFPSLSDKIETKSSTVSGITGLMKGWLWGGKEEDKPAS